MENVLANLGSIASIAGLIVQGAELYHQQNGPTRINLGGNTQTVSREVADAALEMANIIDDDILGEFEKRIKKSTDEYKRRIRKARNAQGLDVADAIAQREICDYLNRIMDRNNGVLTSSYFRKLWKSYKCEKSY